MGTITPINRKVDLEDLTRILTETDGEPDWLALADRYHCHPDSVRRAARKNDLTGYRHRRFLTDAEKARARQLADEGMVGTWIAEEINCAPETVRGYLGARPQVSHEWRTVWHQIFKDDALLALHYEIAPKRGRQVDRVA